MIISKKAYDILKEKLKELWVSECMYTNPDRTLHIYLWNHGEVSDLKILLLNMPQDPNSGWTSIENWHQDRWVSSEIVELKHWVKALEKIEDFKIAAQVAIIIDVILSAPASSEKLESGRIIPVACDGADISLLVNK
jgi:hypothetical protein